MRLLKGRNTPCTATRPVVAGDSCHGIARNYPRALPFDAGVFRSVAEQRLVVGRKLWVAEQLTRRTGFLLESRISLSLVRDGVARHPPHALLHAYMYNNQLHMYYNYCYYYDYYNDDDGGGGDDDDDDYDYYY